MSTLKEIEQISRTIPYTGRVIDLFVDHVRYPSGATGVREIAHHPGGAVVVPLMPNGDILFVRQFRYPFRERILELPAGRLSPGEDPAAAAARELEEETGWEAGELVPLMSIYTTPGFCDEVLHLFIGRDLRQSPHGPRREEGESTMALERLSPAAAMRLVRDGAIRDAKTIIGILLVSQGAVRE